MHTNHVPAAFETFAQKFEGEMPLLQARVRIALGGPCSLVPEHNRTASIFALRDCPFEAAVGEGMIFRSYCQSLVCRVEASAFSHRPTQQHAIQLQPEIVVETGRIVFLDQISKAVSARLYSAGRGLAGFSEIALALVFFESHIIRRCNRR